MFKYYKDKVFLSLVFPPKTLVDLEPCFAYHHIPASNKTVVSYLSSAVLLLADNFIDLTQTVLHHSERQKQNILKKD